MNNDNHSYIQLSPTPFRSEMTSIFVVERARRERQRIRVIIIFDNLNGPIVEEFECQG